MLKAMPLKPNIKLALADTDSNHTRSLKLYEGVSCFTSHITSKNS